MSVSLLTSPDLLQTFINTLLSAEADAVGGAEYGATSPERVKGRNGCRHRDFDTRAYPGAWVTAKQTPGHTPRPTGGGMTRRAVSGAGRRGTPTIA